MELTERTDINAINYLGSITFPTFKRACIDEAKQNKTIKPKDSDMKGWFSILTQFIKCNKKTKGVTKRIYSYSQNTPAGMGGRLFCSGSLQSIWKKYRGLLVRNTTTDIDMKNAHPTILYWVCKKHNIDCPQLEIYIKNRDSLLSEFKTKEQGKELYLIATNSNEEFDKTKKLPQHILLYDAEMKTIQSKLLGIEIYQFLKQTIPSDKKENYEGSFLNRILCYHENEILQVAIHICNKKGIEIAVLMFDGLMIYGDYYKNSSLLDEIESEVENKFNGLSMKWSYKPLDDSLHIPKDFTYESKQKTMYFVDNDSDGAEIVYKKVKPFLKSYKGRLFFKHQNIWIFDKDSIDTYVLKQIMDTPIYRLNEDQKQVPYSQLITHAKHIREALYLKIQVENNDHLLYEKFHKTTKGRVCFTDGMLDFKAKKFYTWKDIETEKIEYYTTLCIPFDYKNYFENPNSKVVSDIKNDIYTVLFADKTTVALNFLSRSLGGHHEDKNFATFIGNRDSGKGVLFDNLKSAFCEYVSGFDLNNILYERNTDTVECSRKNYWLLDYEFVRLAMSQETPPHSSNLKVNSKSFKKLAGGGDEQVARRNYDRFDTHFKIDTTFMFLGNDELKPDTKDFWEHALQFSSTTQFKTKDAIENLKSLGEDSLILENYKIADKTIKDKCLSDEYKKATIYLLYQNYTENSVPILKEASNDDEDGISLRKEILSKYNITRKRIDYCPVSDVVDTFQVGKRKVDAELKSMGITKEKSNTFPYTNKWCYYGIVKKETPEVDIPNNYE